MLQEVKSINAPLHRDPGPSSSQSPPAVPPFDHQKPTHSPHKPESGSHSLVRVVPLATAEVLHHPSMLFQPFLVFPIFFRACFTGACSSRANRSSSKPPPMMMLFFGLKFFMLFVLFSCLYLLFFRGTELELRESRARASGLELDLVESSSSSEAWLNLSSSLG
jgi:hypothetical protein